MLMSSMPEYVETRGAKPIFEKKRELAQELIEIQEGRAVLTNYMRHRMEDEGFIRILTRNPDGHTVGRPASIIILTPKAKKLIAASKTWQDRSINTDRRKVSFRKKN